MTSLDGQQTPKTRALPQNRTALVAALDIGTSKVACLIARLKPCPPADTLRGRTHAVELIGISHIQSLGVKAGAVVDLAQCEQSVRQAVAVAERMARVRVESVLLSVSAGRLQGQLIEAAAEIRGGTVTADDVARVTSTGMRHATAPGRTALHALPVTYSLDGVKGIRDPRGMVARQFGVDMNVVTADASVAKNLMLVVERCHLNVEAMAASPYLAGLSVLTDDEVDTGAAVVDLGAGTTTIATYSNGRFVHAGGFALGGQHITMDLARGLGACIADAERIKTLYGTVLLGGSDARELMNVPAAGDHERDAPQAVSRATIANIIRQRAEEIFEMVRDRLAESPFAAEPRARVILTGGGSLLTGMPELAGQILNRPVRIGRPLGFRRLPNEAKSASFAVPTGLLLYPQFAHLEHVEPRHTRQHRTGTHGTHVGGYFGKVGQWLREGF
jgi:cell division protein FtsA